MNPPIWRDGLESSEMGQGLRISNQCVTSDTEGCHNTGLMQHCDNTDNTITEGRCHI